MTVLPSQAERNSIGIDTYERAILYAAMMLRRSFLTDGEKENLKRLSITTAQSRNNNNILIKGEFPYSNSVTWEQGGDVFKPIHYLSLSDPSNSFSPPSPLLPFGDPYITLSIDPPWVETLEEYFTWVISNSMISLLSETPPRDKVISYRFFDSRSPLPIIEIQASLPFDITQWLKDRHFFNALEPLLTLDPLNVTPNQNDTYFFENDTILGNSLVLNNGNTQEVSENTFLKNSAILNNNTILENN